MVVSNLVVRPNVVRAGQETEVVILPSQGDGPYEPSGSYTVSHSPCSSYETRAGRGEVRPVPARFAGGALRARFRFDGEQEHVLRVDSRADGGGSSPGFAHLYSLEEDLFSRRPYKGDLHIHSNRSDGLDSPGSVAGACRRIGMDFMAVTDHGLYAPSLEAQRSFCGLEIDLRIFPGEEVHPPGNPLHIVNFGGSASVNELFRLPPYAAEVDALAASLVRLPASRGGLPAGVDPQMSASARWCFDRIRALGGLGIFCHPCWFPAERCDLSEDFITHLFDARPWDAVEVVGGYGTTELESNLLQLARYHEERAKGRSLPIVGVSDAHGCETGSLFGWYYTIIFAPSLELADLTASIRGLYSTAVEAIPGAPQRAHGPERLVRFTQFLLRELFPAHDGLCADEGRAMAAHLGGDPDAGRKLSALKGRTARLLQECWGA